MYGGDPALEGAEFKPPAISPARHYGALSGDGIAAGVRATPPLPRVARSLATYSRRGACFGPQVQTTTSLWSLREPGQPGSWPRLIPNKIKDREGD